MFVWQPIPIGQLPIPEIEITNLLGTVARVSILTVTPCRLYLMRRVLIKVCSRNPSGGLGNRNPRKSLCPFLPQVVEDNARRRIPSKLWKTKVKHSQNHTIWHPKTVHLLHTIIFTMSYIHKKYKSESESPYLESKTDAWLAVELHESRKSL